MHIYGYVIALVLFVAVIVCLVHGFYAGFVIGGLTLFGINIYAWINYYREGPEWGDC